MKKLVKTVLLVLCAVLLILQIIYSNSVKNSICNALLLCGKSVIPGLFPIFCIAQIIADSGATALVPKKIVPIFIFLISMVSGYPVGAKLLSSMVKCGQLKEETAIKILPSMICAGPAFVINIVGTQIFSDTYIGLRLYLCQIFANLIFFVILGGLKININRFAVSTKAAKVITGSVKQSADSVINICAYVILFSALSSVITELLGDNFTRYFLYLFEVTGAVFTIDNVYVSCAVLSWSGICVIFQVLSVAEDLHIPVFQLILTRLFNAALSCALLKISFLVFSYSKPIISLITEDPEPAITYNIPFLIVFLFSAVVYISSLFSQSSGKFFKDILG